MDEGYDEMYKTEIRLGETFSYFSIIAILIACLGLFGLSALMSEQRTKEIGIHKVLGAPLLSILVLLSKDFIKLVLIANLIALPLGYYAMNIWLEDFAFRVEIGPGNFIFAALIAFAIAVVTVSYQAVKSALGNPVNALRHE